MAVISSIAARSVSRLGLVGGARANNTGTRAVWVITGHTADPQRRPTEVSMFTPIRRTLVIATCAGALIAQPVAVVPVGLGGAQDASAHNMTRCPALPC